MSVPWEKYLEVLKLKKTKSNEKPLYFISSFKI